MSTGSRVYRMATSGSASLKTPSARFDRPEEVRSFQNEAPSGARSRGGFVAESVGNSQGYPGGETR